MRCTLHTYVLYVQFVSRLAQTMTGPELFVIVEALLSVCFGRSLGRLCNYKHECKSARSSVFSSVENWKDVPTLRIYFVSAYFFSNPPPFPPVLFISIFNLLGCQRYIISYIARNIHTFPSRVQFRVWLIGFLINRSRVFLSSAPSIELYYYEKYRCSPFRLIRGRTPGILS